MAIKKYQIRYVKKYTYTDPETGEQDEFVFLANATLLPLFKSYTGVELSTALADFKRSLLPAVDNDVAIAVAEFAGSDTEQRLKAVMDRPEVWRKMLEAAQDATEMENGISLTEALMTTMRACALPEAERAESLAYGADQFPTEMRDDLALAMELLSLALTFNDRVKKN